MEHFYVDEFEELVPTIEELTPTPDEKQLAALLVEFDLESLF